MGKIIEEMPFHMNDFAMKKYKILREKDFYEEACEILLLLSKWLNRKNYSQYVLIPYSENEPSST